MKFKCTGVYCTAERDNTPRLQSNITSVMDVGKDITALNQVLAESKSLADDMSGFIKTTNAGIDTAGSNRVECESFKPTWL